MRLGLGLGVTALVYATLPVPPVVLPGNVRAVSSDSQYAQAMAMSSAGDIIQLQDGGTFSTIEVKKSGITVRAQTPPNVDANGRRSRNPASATVAAVVISNAQNVTVRDLTIQATFDFMAARASGPDLIAISGNLDGLQLLNNYAHGGDPSRGFVDYVVTAQATTLYPSIRQTPNATFTASITNGVMTVSSMTSGAILPNDAIYFTGSGASGSGSVRFAGGTGGIGNYEILNGRGEVNTQINQAAQVMKTARNLIGSYAPTGIAAGAAGPVKGSVRINGNTVSDVGEGIKFSYNGLGGIEVIGNQVVRPYQDGIAFGPSNNGSPISYVRVFGNEVQDEWAQPQDAGNPHGDACLQWFTADFPGASYNYAVPVFEVCGNIVWQQPGCRGQVQRFFVSDFMDGYPIIAPIVADNLFFSRITSKGISLSATDNVGSRDAEGNLINDPNTGLPYAGTGAVWGLVARNAALSNPKYNQPFDNELTDNPVSKTPAAANSSAATINIGTDPSWGSPPSLLWGNIAEDISLLPTQVLSGNLVVGRGSTATSYDSFLTPLGGGTWDQAWDAIDSADKVVQQMALTKSGVPKVVPTGITTSAAFRARWIDPSSRPYAQLPAWVGFKNQNGVAINAMITSEWSMVQAGTGTRSFYGSGGEYRLADDRFGANATAWGALPSSGAPGTIGHGKFMQVRRQSSSSGSTPVSLTITIGGDTYSWVVQTVSAKAFPKVSFGNPDTSPTVFEQSTAGLGSDGYLGTIALKGFRMSGKPAVVTQIASANASTAIVNIQVLTTGLIRLSVSSSDASSTRMETNVNVCDGKSYDILFAFDLSKATLAEAIEVYVDGQPARNTTSYGSRLIFWSRGGSSRQRFGTSTTGGSAFDIDALLIHSAERADITQAAVRTKFSADLIGVNGSGPFSSPPAVFLVGNAAQWNGGQAQRGTAGAWAPINANQVADSVNGQAGWS
jgi:hypothetical protein